jgi:hypothetical protein
LGFPVLPEEYSVNESELLTHFFTVASTKGIAVKSFA